MKEVKEGRIAELIFHNEENFYTIAVFETDTEQFYAVGYLPRPAKGRRYTLTGEWKVHPRYGEQFAFTSFEEPEPATSDGILSFLSSGIIKGVGPSTAAAIVKKFGDEALKIIGEDPDRLLEVSGIGKVKAKTIAESYAEHKEYANTVMALSALDISPAACLKLYKAYGAAAADIVRENPYLLAAPHIGGTFAEADDMALELGVELKSKNRIAAAVIFELEYNAGGGHCFIPREKLADITAQMIGVEPEYIDDVIEDMLSDGRIIFEQIAGCNACYLPKLYEAERFTAERIAAMAKETYASRMDFSSLISSLEKKQGITYAPLQRQTLQYALENQIVVITGGPGTGKTTTIRAILALFEKLGLKTLLAAPTGRAAKRMTELTGCEAATIHRLLGAKFAEDEESVVFGKNAGDLLECEAVILDECSMVDISLMSALLEAMPADARLVLVGDADQLPSVGPGDVFSAIIRSETVPVIRLTDIFRQNRNSRIVRNAHMINRGEHPDLSENAGDFFRLRRLQAASTVDTITELCATRLPQNMNIPSEEIQVLSPTRKGELGTVNLNKHLQEALNPAAKEKKEKLFGSAVFREGDRVMQIRNNYDIMWRTADNSAAGSGIYNGDIGVIRTIDMETETLSVDFDGRIAVYTFDLLLELEHAWAMTVHKSQGSEFRAVVLALCSTSQMLMSRDILYTAVTRAKELLILVGDDQIAFTMIDNVRQSRRYNALRLRIRKLSGIQGA